ncbi:MAG: hypothetical protein IOC96_13745 [Rhodobacter sp.]|nr:hypothetical protein [Rhodobacter sp.]
MSEAVSGEAGQGGGATPGAAAATDPGGSVFAAPAEPAAEKPWWDAFPDHVKPAMQAKGFKDPTALAESYVNLEKLLGADKAGNAVILPKPDAPAEEVNAFFKKLGVPEDPKGYDLKPVTGFPEGDLGDTAAILHKANVPPALARSIVAATGELLAAKTAQQEAEWLETKQRDLSDLKAEFGPQYDNKIELGRRAAQAAGMNDTDLAVAERVMGLKSLAKLLVLAGEATGEAAAPPPGGPSNFGISREQAQSSLSQKFADPQFMARYLSPNALVRNEAIAEMEKLNKIAAGG